MNKEEIRDEARKAANRSQFMSNHIYDHKSYEDGFYEGMNQALHQHFVRGSLLIRSLHLLEEMIDNHDADAVRMTDDHYNEIKKLIKDIRRSG